MVKYLLILIGCMSITFAQDFSLQTSLKYVPEGTISINYINWSKLRLEFNAETLGSLVDKDKKNEFLLSLQPFIPDTIYESWTIAEYWGWDPTSLVWEVSGIMDEGMFAILAFTTQFELDVLDARYQDYGFDLVRYAGFTRYNHDFSSEPWMNPLIVKNSVLLEDEAILIMASTEEGMQRLLNVYNQNGARWLDHLVIANLVTQLDKTTTAVLVDDSVCTDLSLDNVTQGFPDSDTAMAILESLQVDSSLLHPYMALGIGYQPIQGEPHTKIVMEFASTDDAQADLQPRQVMAQEGVSLITGLPYADYFAFEKSYVAENALILELSPLDKNPARIFDMMLKRDMSFAACP